MVAPRDPRVGPHPYFGRPEAMEEPCALPGCGVRGDVPTPNLHDSSPGGSRVLEAAKAVARLADQGLITGVHVGEIALALLEQALTIARHPSRSERPSERAMRESMDDRRGHFPYGGAHPDTHEHEERS